jgi:hypothetical protein
MKKQCKVDGDFELKSFNTNGDLEYNDCNRYVVLVRGIIEIPEHFSLGRAFEIFRELILIRDGNYEKL